MKKPDDDVTQFHSVDHTTNPTSFVQFMETSHAQPTAQSYKQIIMEQLALQEGCNDSGCWLWNGPGYPGPGASSWPPWSRDRRRQ